MQDGDILSPVVGCELKCVSHFTTTVSSICMRAIQIEMGAHMLLRATHEGQIARVHRRMCVSRCGSLILSYATTDTLIDIHHRHKHRQDPHSCCHPPSHSFNIPHPCRRHISSYRRLLRQTRVADRHSQIRHPTIHRS